MSAEKFQHEIDQAVSRWAKNHPSSPPHPHSNPSNPVEGFQRQIDGAVNQWRQKHAAALSLLEQSAPNPHQTSADSGSGQLDSADADSAGASWFFGEAIGKPLGKGLKIGLVVYLLVLVGIGLIVGWLPETYRFNSWLVYGPRLIFAVPVILIIAGLIWVKARWVWFLPCALALLIALGPIAGGRLPRRLWSPLPSTAPLVRLNALTWDLGMGSLNENELRDLIVKREIDLVVLQNCSASSEVLAAKFRGWSAVSSGHLVLLTRFPVKDHQFLTPGGPSAKNLLLACVVETPGGQIRVVNLNLRRLLSRRDGASREASEILGRVSQSSPVLILGDWNMPAESPVYQRDWSSYLNSFDDAGLGFGYTSANSWTGLRVDHVLGSAGWRFSSHFVESGFDSAHSPVYVQACYYSTPGSSR